LFGIHRFPLALLALVIASVAMPAPTPAQSGSVSQAASPAPLDLAAAVRYGLAHSPPLLAERAVLAQDEAAYAKLHAAEFPVIAGSLQNVLQRQENTFGTYGAIGVAPADRFSQNTAQIGASWNIFTGTGAQLTAQEAKRTADSARLDLRRAEEQFAADIAAAFYDLTARQRTIELATGDAAYQNALLEAARERESVGRVAAVDTLRAQVGSLRSQATVLSAQAAAANAREALTLLIGAPPDTPFAVLSEVPEPALPATPLATMVALAKDSRSDVLAARATLAAAVLANGAIDSDRYPQIQVSGAFGNQYSPTFGSVVPGGGNPGFWQIAASETFTLPLIEYGARRAAHAAANSAIDAARAALTVAENTVEVQIRQALRNAQTADANLQTSKQAAALGVESARIAQLQYRNGLISLTDASAAEQSALQAASDLVSARVAYLTAFVRLRAAIGTDDPVAIVGGAAQ
jgi:multidrug efflux system outer membrane protein